MLLKNEDDTGCATVDLVQHQLVSAAIRSCTNMGPPPPTSGRAKQSTGSAGKSFAAGLGTPPLNVPDYLKIKMDPGFIAVILSDGVISGKDDSWLQEMIASYQGASPGELARTILKASSETNGQEDDHDGSGRCCFRT